MSETTLAVGSQIEVRCPNCRKNREHEILSMKNGKPDQVQCTLCRNQRKYRRPVAQKTAEERLLLKNIELRRSANAGQRQQWDELRPALASGAAKEYSMSAKYRIKDMINHPVFGLGLVQRIIGSQKVEILFEDGVKIMRCK